MGFYVPPRSAGPKTHLPVGILLDTSVSIRSIQDVVNRCVCDLKQQMQKELMLRGIVELCVVHYSSGYKRVLDFTPLEQVQEEELCIRECSGITDTGKALRYILRHIRDQIADWKQKGEKVYPAVVFLLSDGMQDPGFDADADTVQIFERNYQAASEQVRMMEAGKKLILVTGWIIPERLRTGDRDEYERAKARVHSLTSFPDRVIEITDARDLTADIQQFFDLVHQVTNAIFEGTPVDVSINQVLGMGLSN